MASSPILDIASSEYRRIAQRSVLDATADGIAVLDDDDRVAFTNGRLAEMLGCSETELVGHRLLEFVANGGKPAALAALERAHETKTEKVEIPLLRHDASTLWVALVLAPAFDDAGHDIGLVGIVTDITQKRVDERSRRVLAELSRALATEIEPESVVRAVSEAMKAGIGIAIVSPDRHSLMLEACAALDPVVEARLRALRGIATPIVAGTVADEVVRRGRTLLLGPEVTERMIDPYARLAKEAGLGSVLVAPLKVHTRVIGLMAAFRRVDAEPLGPEDLTLVVDVASRAAMAYERARLSEEQKRTTERLQLLADTGALLAASQNVERTLATFARLAVQWLAHVCAVALFDGRKLEALAAAASDVALEGALRNAMDRYRAPTPEPAEYPSMGVKSLRLLRHVDPAELAELALDEDHLTALRRLRLRSMIFAPLVARDSLVGVIWLGRTDDVAYDERDLSLAAELGRRVAQAVDSVRLLQRATDAIAVRDEFLSIASHELNTPLTPLKMQLDSLRRGTFPPERVAEKLDSASRQVTRLAKLVSELLDVSRISGGRLRLEPERIDLTLLVQEAVARIQPEAERAGSTLVMHLAPSCLGSWDRMRIDHVVMSLLSNAVKYGCAKPIEVELVSLGSGVRLLVRDHGVGIAPENQKRVFERFERACSVRHYGGFGLGLWIARQIVEASGGTISVESTPREGSTFTVVLPDGVS